MIEGVVAPFDHKYEVPELAVKRTLPPEQNVSGPPAVIVGVGAFPTVTEVLVDVAEQPPFCVTLTLYEPPVVTLIEDVVAPFDHK